MSGPKVTSLNMDWFLVSDWPYARRHEIKAVPGSRWDPSVRAWMVPVAAGDDLRRLLEHVPEADEHIGSATERLAAAVAAAGAAVSDAAPAVMADGVMRRPLWAHQAAAVGSTEARWAAGRPGVLWNMAMGTGKSAAAAAIIARHRGRVLVLCPKSVVRVWPRELAEALVDPPLVVPLEGNRDRKLRALDGCRNASDVVVVVNIEATRSLAVETALRRQRWDLIICDESHRLKSPTGTDTRAVFRIADNVPRRLALTGTPMPHSPLDIFSQAKILDEAVFGRSVGAFKSRFAIMGGYGAKQVVDWRDLDVLAAKLAGMTYSAGADVLDLPDIHHVPIDVELSHAESRAYLEMYDDGVIHLIDGGGRLEPGLVTASNVLAETVRLAQITGGATGGVKILDPDTGMVVEETEPRILGTSKEDRLVELVEDAGVSDEDPMIVFCRFRHSLAAVRSAARRLGVTYGELSGSQRDGIDDEARLTVGRGLVGVQYQSGGVGVDLTRANKVCCFDQTWNLGEFDQSMKRAHRPGQDRPVTVWHLLARYDAGPKRTDLQTIDHRIAKAIRDRRGFIDSVMAKVAGEKESAA